MTDSAELARINSETVSRKSLKRDYRPCKNSSYRLSKLFKIQLKRCLVVRRYSYSITYPKRKRIKTYTCIYVSKSFWVLIKKSHVATTMVELLHTATLIHDDVVDEASRRGFVSINKIWRNKAGFYWEIFTC